MMHNGTAAIDWGGGQFLDIRTGEFFHAEEKDVCHRALDAGLDWLKRLGRVDEYDGENVFFFGLPEIPRKTAG